MSGQVLQVVIYLSVQGLPDRHIHRGATVSLVIFLFENNTEGLYMQGERSTSELCYCPFFWHKVLLVSQADQELEVLSPLVCLPE